MNKSRQSLRGLIKNHQSAKHFSTNISPQNPHFGIVGMETYFPNRFVSQSALEQHDGVSEGKYTIGLAQSRMAVVDLEREDTVSLAMTAVKRLFEKYSIDPRQVKRLEVGTESPVDKSKSIKSFIMQQFPQVDTSEMEGIDTINACYGATNALFNALYWLNSEHTTCKKNDVYSVVVAVDIAQYEKGPARPTGGAGAVAMLLGRDAPLAFNDFRLKAFHMEHAYDFYKPVKTSYFPTVDGQYSNICYLRALDICYERLRARHEEPVAVADLDYLCFHAPYNKLVQKSFARMIYSDFALTTSEQEFDRICAKYNVKDAETKSQIKKFTKSAPREETYNDNESSKFFINLTKKIYEQKVSPSTYLPRELGNTYAASLYAGFASLVGLKGQELQDKRINMFSYGSGLASAMFELQGRETTHKKHRYQLDDIKNILDLPNRLNNRIEVSPEQYSSIMDANMETYLKHDFVATNPTDYIDSGSYYLDRVDDKHRRFYLKKD
ncbi:hydroxymethylglutaryl coenzyme A synthase [Naegleria gruberi]|uniref:Hydroxymethylglutaryl-CoA synthase n=1 Tax=Naegleria gruberi TaxID=5762 RepID=D2UYB3_NAEGR|nr:hydroxymethylglutaryl coenzyme A synthase [Naegleria gruberi]EFC50763.1 hydroxymethylglutaryl coenzyme A synthase [Naegleria gruberi]|eukprot:XP_002683507.1 hydroxymethylglutaryl coenzyme A synthase [Naegleria gruberi strain NEG-M]